jgi:hypothetical protein
VSIAVHTHSDHQRSASGKAALGGGLLLIDNALVLNGIPVAVKAAEMAISLRRLVGSAVSRRGTYAKASAACVQERCW